MDNNIVFEGTTLTRWEVAQRLAPRMGRSVKSVEAALRRRGDSPEAVLTGIRTVTPKAIVFEGRTFTRWKLAALLGGRLGYPTGTVNSVLQLWRDDPAAAIAHLEKRTAAPHKSPAKAKPPTRNIAVVFEGETLSRHEVARRLAPRLGASVPTVIHVLERSGDDLERVAAVFRERSSKAIVFEGVPYRTRAHLARHLAALTGRTALTCWINLRDHQDNAAAVLALRAAETVVVGQRTYPNRSAFFAHLSKVYGLSTHTLRDWSRLGLTPEQIAERARKQRKKIAAHIRMGPLTLFGWRFNSPRAASRYYGVTLNEPWHDHVAAGKPDYQFFIVGAVKLIEAGELDEHARRPPKFEAVLCPKHLPLNPERLPMDPHEAAWVGETWRRHTERQARILATPAQTPLITLRAAVGA